jgi:hypothetical protein
MNTQTLRRLFERFPHLLLASKRSVFTAGLQHYYSPRTTKLSHTVTATRTAVIVRRIGIPRARFREDQMMRKFAHAAVSAPVLAGGLMDHSVVSVMGAPGSPGPNPGPCSSTCNVGGTGNGGVNSGGNAEGGHQVFPNLLTQTKQSNTGTFGGSGSTGSGTGRVAIAGPPQAAAAIAVISAMDSQGRGIAPEVVWASAFAHDRRPHDGSHLALGRARRRRAGPLPARSWRAADQLDRMTGDM